MYVNNNKLNGVQYQDFDFDMIMDKILKNIINFDFENYVGGVIAV